MFFIKQKTAYEILSGLVGSEMCIGNSPYRETRNYVQAVLAYNVVFQYLLGDTQRLFTPLERQTRY